MWTRVLEKPGWSYRPWASVVPNPHWVFSNSTKQQWHRHRKDRGLHRSQVQWACTTWIQGEESSGYWPALTSKSNLFFVSPCPQTSDMKYKHRLLLMVLSLIYRGNNERTGQEWFTYSHHFIGYLLASDLLHWKVTIESFKVIVSIDGSPHK